MRRCCLSLPRQVSTTMRRVGVCTMKVWMLMRSLPFSSAKCGCSQAMGRISSGVAWGSRKRLPPVISSSTTLLTVTSPMRQLCMPSSVRWGHRHAPRPGRIIASGGVGFQCAGRAEMARAVRCRARPGKTSDRAVRTGWRCQWVGRVTTWSADDGVPSCRLRALRSVASVPHEAHEEPRSGSDSRSSQALLRRPGATTVPAMPAETTRCRRVARDQGRPRPPGAHQAGRPPYRMNRLRSPCCASGATRSFT